MSEPTTASGRTLRQLAHLAEPPGYERLDARAAAIEREARGHPMTANTDVREIVLVNHDPQDPGLDVLVLSVIGEVVMVRLAVAMALSWFVGAPLMFLGAHIFAEAAR